MSGVLTISDTVGMAQMHSKKANSEWSEDKRLQHKRVDGTEDW